MKKVLLLLLSLLTLQLALAVPPAGYPSGFNLLEISSRPWLYSLSLKYGVDITQFSQVPDSELQAFADQGFNMIWFMGVWELGEYGLNLDQTDPQLIQQYNQNLPGWQMPDVIGSPYAVVNYTLNPQLGSGYSDLQNLRQRLSSYGMKLMLDFVPNHSAVDDEFTTTNPMYYINAPPNSGPPYDSNVYLPNGIAYGWGGYGQPWTDTAQFNIFNPDTINIHIQNLKGIASLADAIRCDVAYLLLNSQFWQNWQPQLQAWGYSEPSSEFWSTAIAAVKAEYPAVIFLAEVYYPNQPDMIAVGFDYVYDKTLLDNLASFNLDSVKGWLTSNSPQFISQCAHFLTNHDEPRAIPKFSGEWYLADAAALVTYTLPGMRFFYMWDYDGFSSQITIQLRREVTENPIDSVQTFYSQLLQIVTDHSSFHNGTWQWLNVGGSSSAGSLMAWSWANDVEKILVVCNFTPDQASGSVVLSNATPVNGNDTIPVLELLTGETYYRSASEMSSTGLFVVVNSWYAQIFIYN